MIKPLHDHVVLEVIEKEKTTKSGIILTTEDKDTTIIAKVVAIGPGKYNNGKYEPMHVSINDRVVFKKYSTNEIKIKDNNYLIVKESDILGIVEEW